MPDKTIKFEIVTPEKIVLKTDISQVTVPTQDGDITVLPKHTPLVSILKPGVIELKDKEGNDDVLSVSGGFIEVLRNKVVILADTAERAEELDEKKLEDARKKAQDALENIRHEDTHKYADALVHLERELARTKSLKRWRDLKGKR